MFLGRQYLRTTTLIDNRARSSSQSINLGVNVADHGAQRWDMELMVRPDRGFVRKLMAHRARQLWTPFAIPCPQLDGTGPTDAYLHPYPAAVRLNLNEKASEGSNVVKLIKSAPSGANAVTLYTGRHVSFAGHSKVYQVSSVDDLEFTDDSVVHTVTLSSELIEDVASASYLRLNTDIMVRYDPAMDWAYDFAYLANGGAIHLIEDVP